MSSTHTAADVVRTLLRGLGQTLITAGLVVLLFCFYELKVTNLVTDRAQDRLDDALRDNWAAPAAAPATGAAAAPAPAAAPAVAGPEIGNGFAVIHLPALGDGFARVVVEGVDTETLKKGPGHYPDTALPGELGNTVISGHRTTYGAPFADLDRLKPGDSVVIETRDTWFTYRVTGTTIVSPSAIEVTYPVPGKAGATPRERLLTLTTCHPRFSAKQRMVVRGELAEATQKGAGEPPAVLARAKA